MNSLLYFVCVCSFCFTYESVFIPTHEFSHFYSLPVLSPIPPGTVSKQLPRALLLAGAKPWHVQKNNKENLRILSSFFTIKDKGMGKTKQNQTSSNFQTLTQK